MNLIMADQDEFEIKVVKMNISNFRLKVIFILQIKQYQKKLQNQETI